LISKKLKLFKKELKIKKAENMFSFKLKLTKIIEQSINTIEEAITESLRNKCLFVALILDTVIILKNKVINVISNNTKIR